MNLLNPRLLAKDLANNRISEDEQFRYQIATIVLSFLAGRGSLLSGRWTRDYLLVMGLAFVISLAGTYACFRANKSGDNQDFITRYVCLSVPLTLWATVARFVLYFLIYFVTVRIQGWTFMQFWRESSQLFIFITGALLLIHFVYLYRLMFLAAHLNPKPENERAPQALVEQMLLVTKPIKKTVEEAV
jgi:uncharacterized membrane protein